jgi:hypothetical protein
MWSMKMANQYKPIIVTIKKRNKTTQLERVIELPVPQYHHTLIEHREVNPPEPLRGITILNIYGDEKI